MCFVRVLFIAWWKNIFLIFIFVLCRYEDGEDANRSLQLDMLSVATQMVWFSLVNMTTTGKHMRTFLSLFSWYLLQRFNSVLIE